MDTEHIFIGDEFADDSPEPVTVCDERQIRNRVDGTETHLTFYEEGFLRVRQSRKNGKAREHLLELGFIEPEPTTTRRTASAFLWSALGLGILAYVTRPMLAMMNLSDYVLTGSVILSIGAILSLMLFILRSKVNYAFRTTVGQAVVLSLSASFGCKRKMRAAVECIRKATARASTDKRANGESYLRAEMKAHYKLVEMGVISREACSLSTTQILSKFG